MAYDIKDEFYNIIPGTEYMTHYVPNKVSERVTYDQGIYEYYTHVSFFLQDLWPVLKSRAEEDAFSRYSDCVDDTLNKYDRLKTLAERDGYKRYLDSYERRKKRAEADSYVRYDDDVEEKVVKLLVRKAIDDHFFRYVEFTPSDKDNRKNAKNDLYRRYLDELDDAVIKKLRKVASEDEFGRYSYNYLAHKESAEKDAFSRYREKDNVNSNIDCLKTVAEKDRYQKYADYSRRYTLEIQKKNAEEDQFHRYLSDIDNEKMSLLQSKAIEDNFERYAIDYYMRRKAAISDVFLRYQYGKDKQLALEDLRTLAEKDHYWRYRLGWKESIEEAAIDCLGAYMISKQDVCWGNVGKDIDSHLVMLKNKAVTDCYSKYNSDFYVRRIRAALDFYSSYDNQETDLTFEQLEMIAKKDHYVRYIDSRILKEAEEDKYSGYYDDIENIDLLSEGEILLKAKEVALQDGCCRYEYIIDCVDSEVISLRRSEYRKRIETAYQDEYRRYLCNIDFEKNYSEEGQMKLLKEIAKKDHYRKYEFFVAKKYRRERIEENAYGNYTNSGGK